MNFKHRQLGANRHNIIINGSAFMVFSYETLVAFCLNRNYYVTETNHSATTNKHITQAKPVYVDATHTVTDAELNSMVSNHIAKLHLAEFQEEYL